MWLEMTRDTKHGGVGWEFATCLWSPARNIRSGRWSYWESLLRARKGDVVVHLRGKGRLAFFVGYSSVEGEGYETTDRPTEPGKYAYASSFYRVALRDFVEFKEPFSLLEVFREAEGALLTYREFNESRPKTQREHLFYALQAGRLQCLNGAYLSDFKETLAEIVFGHAVGVSSENRAVAVSTKTGEQLSRMKRRIGQAAFSEQVRGNYNHHCCFPGCIVAEDRLLVGSHIARWSDFEDLRGETANGLCFCLMHDKTFELGLFTLTRNFCIAINRGRVDQSQWAKANLVNAEGKPIRRAAISPAHNALARHWERIGFIPDSEG